MSRDVTDIQQGPSRFWPVRRSGVIFHRFVLLFIPRSICVSLDCSIHRKMLTFYSLCGLYLAHFFRIRLLPSSRQWPSSRTGLLLSVWHRLGIIYMHGQLGLFTCMGGWDYLQADRAGVISLHRKKSTSIFFRISSCIASIAIYNSSKWCTLQIWLECCSVCLVCLQRQLQCGTF